MVFPLQERNVVCQDGVLWLCECYPPHFGDVLYIIWYCRVGYSINGDVIQGTILKKEELIDFFPSHRKAAIFVIIILSFGLA